MRTERAGGALLSERAAGLLLHATSLPGPWGIGEIGPHARRWLRALAAMRQRYWQFLPLGPTGYGDSPYQSLSSFAAHALLVSLDDLRRDGWLTAGDLRGFPETDPARVDFGAVLPARWARLRAAADRFAAAPAARQRGFAAFRRRHAGWLPDYALFAALKAEQGGRAWIEWPAPLARREPRALAAARRRLAREVRREEILQFFFERQWAELRAAAARLGIRLIGDLPIFVAHDSSDVWARRDLFQLDADGNPVVVAGVPPDYFSATGQRWGNPLYRWEAHAADGYRWWIARVRRALEGADLLRLDHFRGLQDYWEIPASEPTAERGRWVAGPRDALLSALRGALGGRLPIVAEDLGIITDEVRALRDRFGLPGMEVLQFLFGELAERPDRIEAIRENSVVYTGTHDNDTARGWFEASAAAPEGEVARARRAAVARLGSDPAAAPLRMIELAWRSPARLAIAPLQDVLGLGSEARMNAPGTAQGNWQWRFAWPQLTAAARARMARLTRAAGRADFPRPGKPQARPFQALEKPPRRGAGVSRNTP